MAAAALASFAGADERWSPLLAGLPPTPELIRETRRYHARQFRPRVALRIAWDWARASGGRPDRVPQRLRVASESADPHLICFGPAANSRFLKLLGQAHAVAPYRVEDAGERLRVYVYDPEYPKDRERRIVFRRGSGGRFEQFRYGMFPPG
jgi:hypothetical protein